VRPSSQILSICQNRLAEKTFLNTIGIKTTKFAKVENLNDLHSAVIEIGLPAILKSNTEGYDGKGQILIENSNNLEAIWDQMKKLSSSPSSILEGFVNFEREVSVVVARGLDGKIVTYPVAENVHQNHILKQTTVPANLSTSGCALADEIAIRIADKINLIGVLAVEMFVVNENEILVNELAPRPHNSAHWTIEGCVTYQFQQLVRCICGLPLGPTTIIGKKIVMTNLLGDDINQWSFYLNQSNTWLHIYGKSETRKGRKMGHVTTITF